MRIDVLTICFAIFSEVGEAPSDTMSEEVDSEVYPSEDGNLFTFLPSTASLTQFPN